MPFGKESKEEGVGLALSGGGFRATLFHAGALLRMNELGMLPSIDRVSSVSGGSITSGLLAVRWNRLAFRSNVATNFMTEIINPLREFCSTSIDVKAFLLGTLLPWKTASDVVQQAYEERLLGTASLQDIPDKPRFVFNATNFDTGVSFRFSKPYAGDYRIGLIKNPVIPLSFAVSASSAFPPVLSPAVRKVDPDGFERVDGADLYDTMEYHKRLTLTDGGVYDNLALQTVWDRYETVLVSDAGAPFDPQPGLRFWPVSQVGRALSITTNQARALRKSALISDYVAGQRKGAYWGIGTSIRNYGLNDVLPVPEAKSDEMASIRTRLNSFSELEQCQLINWGYAVSDAALRRHYLSNQPSTIPTWPYPEFALE